MRNTLEFYTKLFLEASGTSTNQSYPEFWSKEILRDSEYQGNYIWRTIRELMIVSNEVLNERDR